MEHDEKKKETSTHGVYNLAKETTEHLQTKSKDELIEIINKLQKENQALIGYNKNMLNKSMKKIKEVSQMPTVIEQVHESANGFKSYHALAIVKTMLERGDSNETILEVLEVLGY